MDLFSTSVKHVRFKLTEHLPPWSQMYEQPTSQAPKPLRDSTYMASTTPFYAAGGHGSLPGLSGGKSGASLGDAATLALESSTMLRIGLGAFSLVGVGVICWCCILSIRRQGEDGSSIRPTIAKKRPSRRRQGMKAGADVAYYQDVETA